MAVVQPNIGVQEDEATRQRRLEDERLRRIRDEDLSRIFGQFGDLGDLALIMEKMQGGADADVLRNAGLVADADQNLRYSDADRSAFENTLTGVLAKKQAEKTRREATEKAKRLDDAVTGVNNAFAGYDDHYYGDYENKIIQSQLPTITDQYREARRRGVAARSNQGIRKSSATNRYIAKITGDQAATQADLATRARNESESLRGTIESRRAAVLQQAAALAGTYQPVPAAADPSDIIAALKGVVPSRPVIPPRPYDQPSVPDVATPPSTLGTFTTPPAGPPDTLVVQPPAPPPDPAEDPDYLSYLGTYYQQNFDQPDLYGPPLTPEQFQQMMHATQPTGTATPVTPPPSLGTFPAQSAAAGGAPTPAPSVPLDASGRPMVSGPAIAAPGRGPIDRTPPVGVTHPNPDPGGPPGNFDEIGIPPAPGSTPHRGGGNGDGYSFQPGPEDDAVQGMDMRAIDGGPMVPGTPADFASIGMPTPGPSATRANVGVQPIPLPSRPAQIYDPNRTSWAF